MTRRRSGQEDPLERRVGWIACRATLRNDQHMQAYLARGGNKSQLVNDLVARYFEDKDVADAVLEAKEIDLKGQRDAIDAELRALALEREARMKAAHAIEAASNLRLRILDALRQRLPKLHEFARGEEAQKVLSAKVQDGILTQAGADEILRALDAEGLLGRKPKGRPG